MCDGLVPIQTYDFGDEGEFSIVCVCPDCRRFIKAPENLRVKLRADGMMKVETKGNCSKCGEIDLIELGFF